MRYAAVDRIVHRVKPRSGGGFGRDQVQIGHAARKIAPKGRWHNYPLELRVYLVLERDAPSRTRSE